MSSALRGPGTVLNPRLSLLWCVTVDMLDEAVTQVDDIKVKGKKTHNSPTGLLSREKTTQINSKHLLEFSQHAMMCALGWRLVGASRGLADSAIVYRGPAPCRAPSRAWSCCHDHRARGTLRSGQRGGCQDPCGRFWSRARSRLHSHEGFLTSGCVCGCLLLRRYADAAHTCTARRREDRPADASAGASRAFAFYQRNGECGHPRGRLPPRGISGCGLVMLLEAPLSAELPAGLLHPSFCGTGKSGEGRLYVELEGENRREKGWGIYFFFNFLSRKIPK